MIKRYNQFIKGINEDADITDGQPEPITKPAEPTTVPDTPTRPRPTRPGITPTEIPSEEDAPLAYHHGEEEEEGIDVYRNKLKELANMLGVEVENNSINYEENVIIFPSETEMYHVGKKKFKTAQEVVDYLDNNKPGDENNNKTESELDIDEDEFEKGDNAFESTSYRKTRLRKFGK